MRINISGPILKGPADDQIIELFKEYGLTIKDADDYYKLGGTNFCSPYKFIDLRKKFTINEIYNMKNKFYVKY
jgi:hypothetical protein